MTCQHFLIKRHFGDQILGDDVIDVLDENDICIDIIQVLYQRSMSRWAKKQMPFVVSKGAVFACDRQGLCLGLLKRIADLCITFVRPFEARLDPIKFGLKQRQMMF